MGNSTPKSWVTFQRAKSAKSTSSRDGTVRRRNATLEESHHGRRNCSGTPSRRCWLPATAAACPQRRRNAPYRRGGRRRRWTPNLCRRGRKEIVVGQTTESGTKTSTVAEEGWVRDCRQAQAEGGAVPTFRHVYRTGGRSTGEGPRCHAVRHGRSEQTLPPRRAGDEAQLSSLHRPHRQHGGGTGGIRRPGGPEHDGCVRGFDGDSPRG